MRYGGPCMVYEVWWSMYGVWGMVVHVWCMRYGGPCMVYGVWWSMYGV